MLQLYSADISPFAARVRIAIYFKQPVLGVQRTAALAAQAAERSGKRVGAAAEVAHAVLFLMCNRYINASVLHVDGGMRFV